MLKHEPEQTLTSQNPTASIPAAERRVTAEELTRAVSALEDAKAAERVAGVAPIGQVVEELGLDSTPEEIWEQVQKQRAQAAAAQTSPTQSAVVQPAIRPHHRRGRWYLLFAVVCVVYGFSHNWYAAMQVQAPFDSVQTITISGDSQTETIPAQGKDIVITGENDNITLQGRAQDVSIIGDNDRLRGDAPDAYDQTGDGNDVKWTGEPHPVAPRPPSP